MDRDIISLRQLAKIRKLRYTTRGTRRIRVPKGFKQSMREKMLKELSLSKQ